MIKLRDGETLKSISSETFSISVCTLSDDGEEEDEEKRARKSGFEEFILLSSFL